MSRFWPRSYSPTLKNKPLEGEAYAECSTLPMYCFIKLCVTGDLKWLIKSGEPQGLDKVAENIQSEYSELSGDTATNKALGLSVQIDYLKNRIKITNDIVRYLSDRQVPELIEELKNMGYRFAFTNLELDLKRTLTASKSDHIKLMKAESDYANLPKGTKSTEKDWYAKLAQIAKYREITAINPHNITVMEFIVMDNELNEYVRSLKNRNGNNRNGR